MMDEIIQPNVYVAIRLPSDQTKVQQILPNTTISLGKYGNFYANHIIGRPYHFTYEIIEKVGVKETTLRVIGAAELYEDIKDEDDSTNTSTPKVEGEGEEYEVVNQEGKVVMRTNRNVNDDGLSQKLSSEDIEALKKEEGASGRDTIAKILESHTALDKKTAFSLAKYTLRKRKKYLKRFTVFPLDVAQLANYFLYEKEPKATMEMREEILSLLLSWSNVHCGGQQLSDQAIPTDHQQVDHNRYLAVDETGGLIVAAMAERMGVLYPNTDQLRRISPGTSTNGTGIDEDEENAVLSSTTDAPTRIHNDTPPLTKDNTITLIHPATQPNLALLNYFSYDPSAPFTSHPLHSHLKTLSWLQLLHPEEDSTTHEPTPLSPDELSQMKAGKRSAYYRKRRRWNRISRVVSETQEGGFAGLVVASYMNPNSVLNNTVPLLRGGAQVVVYSPTIEPLVELMDYYSTARRGAFLSRIEGGEDRTDLVPSEDFPVDPTLLLATALHTARARPWQVLPGRTHPLMMGRGGAEGYVFVGTRVLPSEGKIEARGSYKRRKTDKSKETAEPSRLQQEIVIDVEREASGDRERIVDMAEVEDS